MLIILTLFVIVVIFLVVIYLFQKFKLYKHEKYKVYISLFVALNVLFTCYIIFIQINNHNEELSNENSKFYQNIMTKLFNDTLKIFRENPHMNYFYNEMFNGIPYQQSGHIVQRDKVTEQNIVYTTLSSIANYAVYYYAHVKLENYREMILTQRYRCIKIINRFLESPIFKEHLETYFNDFAGLNNLKFFKEFFNITQTNPDTDEEKLIATHKIVDGVVEK